MYYYSLGFIVATIAAVTKGVAAELVATATLDATGDVSTTLLVDQQDVKTVPVDVLGTNSADVNGQHDMNDEEAKGQSSHVKSSTAMTDGPMMISVALHRNGEPQPCGTMGWSSSTANDDAMMKLLRGQGPVSNANPTASSPKFLVETYLTSYMASQLLPAHCASMDNKTAVPLGFLGYCDMGPLRTVIQLDHYSLISLPTGTLPCRFYTREGVRITSLEQINEMAVGRQQKQRQNKGEKDGLLDSNNVVIHLYAVPAGRMFMFAPSYIGETFEIQHVRGYNNKPIRVTTLALEPRLFDVENFFSGEESDLLIQKSLSEKSEIFGFHRSTTGGAGSGQVNIYSKRTSENAWDTQGETALRIKKRSFAVLGIDEYHEEMADGLQVLRYNKTAAYVPHMDYMDDRSGVSWYDYNTAGKGGNRFATILLYMNDLEEGSGGETVFPKSWPSDVEVHNRIPRKEAIKQLRASGDAASLRHGSWEEEMLVHCRTKLTVKPKKGRAVLFYSQLPNGVPDPKSKHGGCPVLKGIKYAANLWTWSAVRKEWPGAPHRATISKPSGPKQVQAIFRNIRHDSQFAGDTQLFYAESTYFGNLGPNDPPIHVNTYEGHVWNIRVNGLTVRSFIIQPKTDFQEFDF